MPHLAKRRNTESGASLIEFALIMPLLLLMVLGIVELGFLLGERSELKHGAHEGARLAAVNNSDPLGNTCASMNLPNSTVHVAFTHTGVEIGDTGTIVVSMPSVTSLTGLSFVDFVLPASMSVDLDFRLEQKATWVTPLEGDCP